MTQQELARRAGISRSTVLHIVKGGHCGTDTLERIAKALEVDVAELFTAPLDIGVRRDRMIAEYAAVIEQHRGRLRIAA